MKRFEAIHISPLLSTWEEEVGNNIGRGKKYNFFTQLFNTRRFWPRCAHPSKKGRCAPCPPSLTSLCKKKKKFVPAQDLNFEPPNLQPEALPTAPQLRLGEMKPVCFLKLLIRL